ncbi:outer membrane protein OmpA-like peptidoglycan-associated protein [Brevundimonas alba]|uniref:Outer membrane protein OmpA-like peptidoglycan-associated protein n=1 Tax=Brevundimonas alba TaxID=74314 RepID=A0A7X5YLI4_9CAUL|nr:OmpA family protein [Brevundimonas alba]NJC42165.1 outer membrane protein OmpA-like peptidoglycan-associated protein [Brevundimonas alba]
MRSLTMFAAVVSVIAVAAPAWANEFLDYFDYGRTELSANGYVMARRVIQYTQAAADPRVTITGHMDTAEAAEFSDEIAGRRAQAVATELVRLGMDPGRIRIVSRADRMLARPTPAGVREPLNRRVMVSINFGGWPETATPR